MSVFSTNQVEELIVGNAVATETTADTFISTASPKEIKVLSSDGTAPAVGKDFKFLQKTSGSSPLNYEFSDTVKADKVLDVVLVPFKAAVEKSVAVTGFDANVLANHTYAVEIRVNGPISVENFDLITGYYVTGSNVTGVTPATIRDGIEKSLNANLDRRGSTEFVITTPDTGGVTDLVITSQSQPLVLGKKDGKSLQFDVTAKVFDNVAITSENLGLLVTEVLDEANPGAGTGKYVANLEWFTKGFKYEAYRETGYPADFGEPYYVDASKDFNIIHVVYYSDRANPSVETQRKVITVAVEYDGTVADNAVTNSVLADLRTALGSDKVPADLAVV